jgi:hypothetical protein
MSRRLIHILSLIVFGTLFLVTVPPSAAVETTSNLTITAPGPAGAVLAEVDEFATMVMGDPWDMEQPTDLAYYREDSRMENSTFANGIYSAQMTNGNGGERITLLTAGAPNNTAMRIGKIGYNYPIDADHYRYLTYRLYKSHEQFNSGVIQWFAHDTYTTNAMGVSNGVAIPTGAGWHTIVVDLQAIGIQMGEQKWEGTIRELLIKPFAGPGAAGATVKLDWARLTAEDPRTTRPYTIRWQSGSGTIDLYASIGNKSLSERDVLIASGVDAAAGSYTFYTGILPAGDYYIAAKSGNTVSWSDGPLIINTVPTVTIDKPSKISGEDYAETVLGKAWDMTDVTDLNHNLKPWEEQSKCVNQESFVNGTYTAHLISNCPNGANYVDPILYLGHLNRTPEGQMDPTIDTTKYRYLSYRFYHSGTQNVTHGWVARWGWWQVNDTKVNVTEDVVMGRDLIILEGWQTYKVDLWAPDVVDEAHPVQRSWQESSPNRLRFDPSELRSDLMPAHVKLDWIKLTAMDEVKVGEVFPILFNVSKSETTLTFYYEPEHNPHNQRMLIGQTNLQTTTQTNDINTGLINSSHTVYLPLIMYNSGVLDCPDDRCFAWNTANIAPGIYHVCIEVEDAYNSFYQCSEAPFVVRR